MFHNTLVVDSSIRKPGKSSKTAKRPAICRGVRPGELVGLEPCSITLWWLVRVRPAPPRSRLQPENTALSSTPHSLSDFGVTIQSFDKRRRRVTDSVIDTTMSES